MQGEAIDQILLQQRFIFSEGGGAMAIGFGESDSFGKLARGEGGNRPLFMPFLSSYLSAIVSNFLSFALLSFLRFVLIRADPFDSIFDLLFPLLAHR